MKKIFPQLIISILMILTAQPLLSSIDSSALFEQGMKALNSGNYRSSELLFRKIIEADDGLYKDRAWFNLALSIFHQKKYKSAIFELNRFLSICTTSDLCSEARFWIAESHFFQKKYIKAIEEYKRFISQSKNQSTISTAYDRIGRIYFEQKRYDEAIIEWEKAKKISKDKKINNLRTLYIGEALFNDGKLKKVINLLNKLINTKIEKTIAARSRLILGRAYQLMNKHRKALLTFNDIKENLLNEPPFYNSYYYKAISSISLGNISSAKIHLKSFILIGKNSTWYYEAKYELGAILIKEGKDNEAIKILEEVRNSTTKQELKGKTSVILSKLYFNRNPEEAITYIHEAINLSNEKDKIDSLFLLGKAYIHIKRYKDALLTLKHLIDDYPYNKKKDNIQFLIARVYLEQGDMVKAIEEFEKIKEINPFSRYIKESYYYLAIAHLKNNQHKKAVELLNEYLNIKNPEKKYEAIMELVFLYLKTEKYKEASKKMEIIIKQYHKKPGVEKILFRYATELKKKELPTRRYYYIIVRKYPESETAGRVYLMWGDEAFVNKEFKKAAWFYTQYLSVKGRKNAASVFLYRIISLYKLKKYDDIISLLQKKDVPAMDSYTTKQISLWWGRSLFQTENYEEAYNVIYNWDLKDYSLSDILIISKIALKLGNLKTAKDASILLQENKEFYADSLYSFGLYYLEKEEFDDAMGYFSRILIECPTTEFVDLAKIEISEIFIIKKRYSDAIQTLNEIGSSKILHRKNAMLITVYFKTKNYQTAISLSNKYIKQLIDKPFGKTAVEENLLYYYNTKKTKKFKEYSKYYKKYEQNNFLVNYLSGKLYFELNTFKSSYYYFYKLANAKCKYTGEALYYLGVISLFQQKNKRRSMDFFKKMLKETSSPNKLIMKGKMNLSILLAEKGDINESKKILMEMLNNSENSLSKALANNLLEYFSNLKQ